MTASTKRKFYRIGSPIVLVLAALSLFLAQSSYWVNHTVFDQQNFSEITTTALLSDSSRDAIATTVVNQALSNRPLVKQAVGEKAISLTSGLLDSDFSTQAVSALSSRIYAYATAKDRQDIAIDLTAIKAPITTVLSLAQSQGISVPQTQYKIPDQVVLLQSDAFPNFSGLVQTMLWVGSLFWLATLLLFALYIYVGRKEYAKRVYMAGGAIIVVSILGLLTSPFLPPPIAAAVPNINLRPVAENLATGFLAPFKTQMYYMLGITLLALLAFNQRFNVLGLVRKFSKKS